MPVSRGDVLALDSDVLWAVDLNHGGAALLIGLLLGHDQPMVYITGLTMHRASASYRGEGKTDAKDAFVIADRLAGYGRPGTGPTRLRPRQRQPAPTTPVPPRPAQRLLPLLAVEPEELPGNEGVLPTQTA